MSEHLVGDERAVLGPTGSHGARAVQKGRQKGRQKGAAAAVRVVVRDRGGGGA